VVADVGAVEGDDERPRPRKPRHPSRQPVVGVDEVKVLLAQERPQPPRRRQVLVATAGEFEEVDLNPPVAHLVDLVADPASALWRVGVRHEVVDH
jgi:hypothetical protein